MNAAFKDLGYYTAAMKASSRDEAEQVIDGWTQPQVDRAAMKASSRDEAEPDRDCRCVEAGAFRRNEGLVSRRGGVAWGGIKVRTVRSPQ